MFDPEVFRAEIRLDFQHVIVAQGKLVAAFNRAHARETNRRLLYEVESRFAAKLSHTNAQPAIHDLRATRNALCHRSGDGRWAEGQTSKTEE